MSDPITPWDIYLHGVTAVLTHRKTAFQEMSIVETGAYGKALILDGQTQSSLADEFLYHEALVHPAAIAHGGPRRAIVLGGGEGAAVREILRWRTVEHVVMVDIDGEVVEACREHLPEMHDYVFDDPRVELAIADALTYVENCDQQWDVIVSDLSDPVEAGPSFPLFTKEYFETIRTVLHPEGYFVVQAGPVSPVTLQLHTRLARTVATVFSHTHSYISNVPSYGMPWGFILGSAQPIQTRPDPEEIDRLLAQQTRGGFRLVDGSTLLGLLQTPLYVRQAIAAEREIFTLSQPPQAFGRGILRI
jgi:spermidine synthase